MEREMELPGGQKGVLFVRETVLICKRGMPVCAGKMSRHLWLSSQGYSARREGRGQGCGAQDGGFLREDAASPLPGVGAPEPTQCIPTQCSTESSWRPPGQPGSLFFHFCLKCWMFENFQKKENRGCGSEEGKKGGRGAPNRAEVGTEAVGPTATLHAPSPAVGGPLPGQGGQGPHPRPLGGGRAPA